MSVLEVQEGGQVFNRRLGCDAGRFASPSCVGLHVLRSTGPVDLKAEGLEGWVAAEDPFGRVSRWTGERLVLHLCPACADVGRRGQGAVLADAGTGAGSGR